MKVNCCTAVAEKPDQVQNEDDFSVAMCANTHDRLASWALTGSRNRAVQPQRLPDGPTHPVVSAPRRAGVTATGDWRATPARQYGPEDWTMHGNDRDDDPPSVIAQERRDTAMKYTMKHTSAMKPLWSTPPR